MLEKAKAARTNYCEALRLRADCDSSLGCNDQEGDRWASTKAFMYHERVTRALTQITHYCICADPGTHSYKEVMPGIVYSWELDMAAFLTWQRVVAAKAGLHYEDTEIDETMLSFFLQRKLEKVATFRQIQGPSKFSQTYIFLGRGVDLPEPVHFSNPGYANMISNMTNGKVSIDHFKVPLACCIRRLRFGEARVTERVGDITLHYIRTVDGGLVCIMPNYVKTYSPSSCAWTRDR